MFTEEPIGEEPTEEGTTEEDTTEEDTTEEDTTAEAQGLRLLEPSLLERSRRGRMPLIPRRHPLS